MAVNGKEKVRTIPHLLKNEKQFLENYDLRVKS